MSSAVDAIILIRLDARAGQWVGVDELSRYMQVDAALVSRRLELLAQDCGVSLRRVDGAIHSAAVPAPPPRNPAEAATEWV